MSIENRLQCVKSDLAYLENDINSPGSKIMKTCPNCQNELSDISKKCKYCDYRFEPVDVQEAPIKKQKLPVTCSVMIVLLGLIAVLFVVLITRPKTNMENPQSIYADEIELGGIPGIHPSDITVNLEDREFDCTKANPVEDEATTHYIWYCDREYASGVQLHVGIFSSTLQTVDQITADVVADPDSEITKEFLTYLATFPFIDNGEMQENAKVWVIGTLPDVSGKSGDIKDTILDNIKYELYGGAGVRILDMSSSTQ